MTPQILNSHQQRELVKAKEVSDNLQMILNADKIKKFCVNPSLNYQFQPRIRIPGSNNDLEVVASTKLVGVTLTSDLKFHKHIENIVKASNNKLWMLLLRQLKKFGMKGEDLSTVSLFGTLL